VIPILDELALPERETSSQREAAAVARRMLISGVMAETRKGVPHLFDCWRFVSKRIRAAQGIRLFLDFDGTLVPYCDRPEDVELSAACRRILARLSRHRCVHVAIVSGRRNAALRKYVPVPHIQFWGLFGWEKRGRPPLPRKTRKVLRGLRPAFASLPASFPGIRVEDKRISFAVHFRGASPKTTRDVQIWIRGLLKRIRPDFQVIQSNYACEIAPRQVQGKGAAIRELIRTLRYPFLPIYVGDDSTDEPAFSALRRGITVCVAPVSRTNAHFQLGDHQEVCAFLERLEDELP
jgi:trehalose 6-phosphate phosphatase